MAKLNALFDEQSLIRCCEQIEALTQQLAMSIDAIERRQLSTLEKSLDAQQHCLAKLLMEPDWIKEASKNSLTPQMYVRLHASVQKLVQLNKQYSALLEHASRSLQLLQAMDPKFALTASPGTMRFNLARSVSRDLSMQSTLSWHS